MTTKQTLLFLLLFSIFFTACDSDDDSVAAYTLNQDASSIEWHGAGPAAEHRGAFTVKEETLRVENQKITQGTFTIPIASITNFDLPAEIKPVLLGHLMTSDFFNVALYPTASFTIVSVTPYTGSDDNATEDANFLVTGSFTMLGKTRPIVFPARIIFADNKFTVDALLTINRTQWGMNYMADQATAKEHYIYQDVDLHIKLAGQRSN